MTVAKVLIEVATDSFIDFKDATDTQKNNCPRHLFDKKGNLIKKMTTDDIKSVEAELNKQFGK